MKRILFSITFLLLTSAAFSQVVFDLGLKAGVNTSKMSVKEGGFLEDYGINLNSSAITKAHWGAFGRVGLGRLYVQPEVYFSKKGSELSSDFLGITGDFNYKNIDVPLLLGFKLINAKAVDFRIMAGPVFSFIIDGEFPEEFGQSGDFEDYDPEEFMENNLIGIQYGLGVDFLFMTFDARIEHGSEVYNDPDLVSGRTTSYMFTVGFKIL